MKYAVIDIETTGGSAEKERITEIAVVIHDGHGIVDEFSTLINPERKIPPYITDITGISDAMVAKAPKFYEIARQIVELTDGCIFVAHNVNFDYGFIREEFKRLGYQFEREKLCTVRMSRILIPGLPSYSLGPLCQKLGIPNHARHRAKGDADATVLLLEALMQIQPSLGKQRTAMKDPFASLPSGISRKSLSMLPEDPGLYFFHDESGQLLYVNAGKNIRQDALKELQMLCKSSSKSILKAQDISEVTWELTGNELVALLRLDSERGRLEIPPQPLKEKTTGKFTAFSYQDQRGYLRLYVDKLQKNKTGFGEFASEADVKSALEARIRRHQLCPQLGGVEPGNVACSWHRSAEGSCKGACMGLEAAETYNARLGTAVLGLGLPHPSFFLLGEGRNRDEIVVVGFERGEILGFAFLDSGQGWEDTDFVKGLLQPISGPESAKRTLKAYLSKNRMAKLVPF